MVFSRCFMIEGLKPLYNASLLPVARMINRMGIHPNILTLLGVILFTIGSCFTAIGYWKIAFVIGILGACMDGMDGVLARESGKISTFGGVLDSVCDRLTEIVWIAGLIVYYLLNPSAHMNFAVYSGYAAITGSMMVSYVKARAESAGYKCSRGILQRPERLILLGIFQLTGPIYMPWGLGFIAILAYITFIERIVAVWRQDTTK